MVPKLDTYMQNKELKLTYHNSSRHGIPFQPKSNKRWCHQNDPRDKNCSEVKWSISREDEIHFEAAVIT